MDDLLATHVVVAFGAVLLPAVVLFAAAALASVPVSEIPALAFAGASGAPAVDADFQPDSAFSPVAAGASFPFSGIAAGVVVAVFAVVSVRSPTY